MQICTSSSSVISSVEKKACNEANTVEKEGCNEANSYQAEDDFVDNSLALVKVDLPKESQPSDPIIVNASVKDVLEALRHAREKLQWSMERRKMIKARNK